jgi:hypothetical protein
MVCTANFIYKPNVWQVLVKAQYPLQTKGGENSSIWQALCKNTKGEKVNSVWRSSVKASSKISD